MKLMRHESDTPKEVLIESINDIDQQLLVEHKKYFEVYGGKSEEELKDTGIFEDLIKLADLARALIIVRRSMEKELHERFNMRIEEPWT